MPGFLRIAPLLHKVTIVAFLLTLEKHANKALQAGNNGTFSVCYIYSLRLQLKIQYDWDKQTLISLLEASVTIVALFSLLAFLCFIKSERFSFFSIIFSLANTRIGAVCGCMPYLIFMLSIHIMWHSEANTFILEPHKYSVGSAVLFSTQCQIVSEFVSNFCHSLRHGVTSRIFPVSPLYCSFLTYPEETSKDNFFWEGKISQTQTLVSLFIVGLNDFKGLF